MLWADIKDVLLRSEAQKVEGNQDAQKCLLLLEVTLSMPEGE